MAKVIKDKIRQYFVNQYSNLFSKDKIDEKGLEKVISQVLEETINCDHISLSEEEKKRMVKELLDEFIGFGPIENLLKDPLITEIMINGPKKVYVERISKTQLTDITFESKQQVMQLIYKLLMPTRRRVDESYPYTEVALDDGSRVNIIIPPLALDGPNITIRKFLKEIKNIEDLINLGTLDKRMAEFLVASIKAKLNIIFAGATGAGKTTTLNVLSSYIPNDERIITIEDTAELKLMQEHVVRLETRQPNIEGKGEVTIRELFRNSLRMRPDRIIIGEIRSAEVLDMLQAIRSGHRGSLSIIHAGSPQDVISRMETMILFSGIPISLETIDRQIAATINLIVQQEQLLDGTRKITHVTQVNGLKDNQLVPEDIFIYDMESIDAQGKVQGSWKATGVMPIFYSIFKKSGIELSKDIFNKD